MGGRGCLGHHREAAAAAAVPVGGLCRPSAAAAGDGGPGGRGGHCRRCGGHAWKIRMLKSACRHLNLLCASGSTFIKEWNFKYIFFFKYNSLTFLRPSFSCHCAFPSPCHDGHGGDLDGTDADAGHDAAVVAAEAGSSSGPSLPPPPPRGTRDHQPS